MQELIDSAARFTAAVTIFGMQELQDATRFANRVEAEPR